MTTDEAAEAAAHWLMTFIADGGTVVGEPGQEGLYWPEDPPMPNRAWLYATFVGEVRNVIHAVICPGPGAGEARAAAAAKVREIIRAARADPPTLH